MAENKKSILVVDDALTNLQIINGLLKNEYNLFLAKSGRIALSTLKHITPDLILLDIEMSDISGFEMMEVINRNERLKEIPVIFVTALSSKDAIFTAGRLGAIDFVVKPFEPELLKAKIYNALKEDKTFGVKNKPVHTPTAGEIELEKNIELLSSQENVSGIHMKIINALIEFHKAESVKVHSIPTYFDINEFFTGIVSLYSAAAEAKGLFFHTEISPSLPHIIFGDEIRLQQAAASILGSVIKYTNQGYVRFNVGLLSEDNTEYFASVIEGSELNVIDDFIEILNKSEAYETPKLPIAVELADMMGGDIYCTYAMNKGSSFIVRIPLVRAESVSVKQIGEFDNIIAVPGVKVLVMDDNPVNLRIAVSMLSKHGIASETAASGEEGLRLIQNTRFDLIFMDHMMHGMDGAETAKAIRALEDDYYKEVPIIALSAYTDDKARELFLKNGMNDFVAKPINDGELNMALKNWLPRAKLMDNSIFTGQSNKDGNEAEINELLNRVAAASGQELSIISGLKNVGGDKKLYIEVLAQFCTWIDNDMRLLTEAVKHKRWKDYAVRMHALKTVFANIGDPLLSNWAAGLEDAANEGNIEKCVKETDYFRANVKNLHARLDGVLPAKTEEQRYAKNTISNERLENLLNALSESCLSCRLDQTGAILRELRQSSLDNDMDGYLSEISGYMDSLDFDKVYDICQKMIDALLSVDRRLS